MAVYPDTDAQITADQVLHVVFILAVSLVNCQLLLVVLRQGRQLYLNQRHWLLVTAVVGDVLLAVFSLVVDSRLAFSDYSGLRCAEIMNAYVYRRYAVDNLTLAPIL